MSVMDNWDLIIAGVVIAIAHVVVYYFMTLKKPKDLRGKHCVVTGGSQGIGLGVAISCAKRGANVTILARNVQQLQEAQNQIAKARFSTEQVIGFQSIDLTTNYTGVAKTFQDIEKISGPIFMLVNCAGMAICGRFEDITVDDARKMMDINYFGSYNAAKYVVPKMKAAREGILVFTASQAALVGIYGYSAYAATKFALRGLAETIAMETKQYGVSVTLALPADTDTPGFEKENTSKPEETKLISGSAGLANPEEVGEQIVTDALTGSFFSILGAESWILSILCVGMSTWTGPFLTFFQFLFMGPLRLVGLALHWNFQRIIKSVMKQESKDK